MAGSFAPRVGRYDDVDVSLSTGIATPRESAMGKGDFQVESVE